MTKSETSKDARERRPYDKRAKDTEWRKVVAIRVEAREKDVAALLRSNGILCLYELGAKPSGNRVIVPRRDLEKVRKILPEGKGAPYPA